MGAVSEVQHARGGDRHCGRKLSTYLRQAGFDIASVVILPEAQHRVVHRSDGERALVLQQLHSARERIVRAGAMTPQAFDADLATLEADDGHEEFRMNARIIVLAHKTGPDAGYQETDRIWATWNVRSAGRSGSSMFHGARAGVGSTPQR